MLLCLLVLLLLSILLMLLLLLLLHGTVLLPLQLRQRRDLFVVIKRRFLSKPIRLFRGLLPENVLLIMLLLLMKCKIASVTVTQV